MKMATTISRSVFARTVAALCLREVACCGRWTLMLLLAALIGVPPLSAQLNSTPQILLADFNGDGIQDVLVPSPSTNSFTLTFGSVPFGSFSALSKSVPYPAGCTAVLSTGTAVGDFNGDGLADIALTCAQNTTYILLGAGDGTFTAAGSLPDSLTFVTVGDFNHDGKLDIAAVGNQGEGIGSIYVYSGDGDGTFAAATTTTVAFSGLTAVLAVDLNADGYPDLVLGYFTLSQGTESLGIYANNKDGTFGVANGPISNPTSSVNVGTAPAAANIGILAGNFYGTGLPDLAVVDTGSAPGVLVIQNNSTDGFSFGAPAKTAVAGLTGAVAANFTSAYSDLLVADGQKLSVLANNGAGTFAASYAGLSVASGSLFAATDANGDGHADIYSAAITSTGASLTVDLVSGAASATSQPFSLPPGTAPVTAAWSGNINFTGSTLTGSQIVSALATTISLASSKNPSKVGDAVTFTATVAPAAAGGQSATGTVTFFDSDTTLGTAPLGSTGQAAFTTSTLTSGTHTLTVTYSGDTNFAASSLPLPLNQVVNGVVPTITWPTPAAVPFGTALSGTQLDATATSAGVTVPGTFVYTPSAGTVLAVGSHTLSATFTPTDPVTYTAATGTVTLVVTAATPTLTWTPAVTTIAYGTALGAQQLNAVATGVGGISLPGTFVYTPASGTVLAAGTHALSVTFTPTGTTSYTLATATTQIIVSQAAPVITWPTPASIAYGVPLGAAQLNATVAGVTGTALPGTLVYTPTTGTILNPGVQTLSTTFTPTDAVDYSIVTATTKITITDVTLSSFTPSTAPIASPDTTITITGSGIVPTTVVQVNGSNIPTTLVNATTLTAVIPAADFLAPGNLEVTLKNPSTGSISGAVAFVVTAPSISGSLTGPPTTSAGTQPTLNFTVPAYPVDITATLTISLTSALPSGVTDAQNVVFANGSSVFSFVIKAGTTTIPTIQLAAGTVAESITVTPVLSVGGVPITAQGLEPAIINVPAAVPQAMSTTLTRSGNQLTVTIIGFSNTREITSAAFHFVPADGATLTEADLSPDIASTFAAWFNGDASPAFGSSFTYTQNFTLSDNAASIGSVQVTLTNSVGTSTVETAQ